MSSLEITYEHNLLLDPQDVVRVFLASGITRPVNDVSAGAATAALSREELEIDLLLKFLD